MHEPPTLASAVLRLHLTHATVAIERDGTIRACICCMVGVAVGACVLCLRLETLFGFLTSMRAMDRSMAILPQVMPLQGHATDSAATDAFSFSCT